MGSVPKPERDINFPQQHPGSRGEELGRARFPSPRLWPGAGETPWVPQPVSGPLPFVWLEPRKLFSLGQSCSEGEDCGGKCGGTLVGGVSWWGAHRGRRSGKKSLPSPLQKL